METLWFLRAIPMMLLTSIIPMILMGFALYFIIKFAVKRALIEYDNDKGR